MLFQDLHKDINSNSSHRSLLLILTHGSRDLCSLTLTLFCMNELLLGFIYFHSEHNSGKKLSYALHCFSPDITTFPVKHQYVPIPLFHFLLSKPQTDIQDRIIGANYTNYFLLLPCDLQNDYQFSGLLTSLFSELDHSGNSDNPHLFLNSRLLWASLHRGVSFGSLSRWGEWQTPCPFSLYLMAAK